LQLSPKKFDEEKRIRRIRRKNKGLTILRKHEGLIKNNDSILRLVGMTIDERTSFFEQHIKKIKKEDEERKQQLLNAQNFGNTLIGGIGSNKNAGKWYFYSSQSKSFGKSEFKNIWGNRPLVDNWRWSDKTIISKQEIAKEEAEVNKRYELATYMDVIPSNSEEIVVLKENRNKALYELGIIYKEQFKNVDLAVKNFELLKITNTDDNLNLPINYHLYQLYTNKKENIKADEAKDFIFKNYPNSKFTEIIKSPNKRLVSGEEKEDEISKKYKELYYLYKNNKFDKVVKGVESFQQIVNNSEFIPKLALLKALAIGKYKTREAYKKELEYVAISFANREEGKKAQEIIKLLNNPQKTTP